MLEPEDQGRTQELAEIADGRCGTCIPGLSYRPEDGMVVRMDQHNLDVALGFGPAVQPSESQGNLDRPTSIVYYAAYATPTPPRHNR